jgi:hypothetical protein
VTETEAMVRGTRDACRRCGEPLGTFRFCLNCGASVAEDELGPSVPPPAPTSRVRRALRAIARWRAPLVVVPLLALLATVAGVGAQMLTAEIPDPPPQVQVTCWDGSQVGSGDACTMPSGEEGLRWVFPTFHPNRDDCLDVLISHPEYTRPAMFECDFKVAGRWVKVSYMELAGVDPARIYFEKDFPNAKRETVRTAEGTPYRYVWRKYTAEGYELAAMYIDFPYAVGIVARDAAHRDAALRELEFRHPDRMSVASE